MCENGIDDRANLGSDAHKLHSMLIDLHSILILRKQYMNRASQYEFKYLYLLNKRLTELI